MPLRLTWRVQAAALDLDGRSMRSGQRRGGAERMVFGARLAAVAARLYRYLAHWPTTIVDSTFSSHQGKQEVFYSVSMCVCTILYL